MAESARLRSFTGDTIPLKHVSHQDSSTQINMQEILVDAFTLIKNYNAQNMLDRGTPVRGDLSSTADASSADQQYYIVQNFSGSD